MKYSNPHVLYIEDDADTRELVWFVLTKNNCRVTLASDCEEALRLARNTSFDLYIVDNWMPGGSGIDFCRQLRQFDAKTPILFYSGAAYDSDKYEALAAGAQGYLTKPVDNDKLAEEVFTLIWDASIRNAPPRRQLAKSQTYDYLPSAQLTTSG
jgi:DNA-binding response OmpR family regulator